MFVSAVVVGLRPMEQLGKRKLRKTLPIQEKESVKWIEGLNQVTALKSHFF